MDENHNIYVEQVKQVNSQHPVGFVGTAINSVILITVLWPAVSHRDLLIWFGLMGLLTFIRIAYYYKSKEIPITPENAERKALYFKSSIAISGIGWGVAGIFLFPPDSVVHQVFIAFVLAGLVAGAVGTFSALRSAFLTFSLPVLLPLIVRFLLGGDYLHIAMGGMTVLFAILTYATSIRIYQNIHTTLKLRFENRNLVKDLETARDRVENANVKLREEIDERKQAEHELKLAYDDLKSTQDQLIQSAKLASIGELASGVAHELNQPLTVLRTGVQILQRNIQKGPLETEDLAEHLEPMERHTKRMMNIISHLKSFSRKSQTGFSLLDINEIIDGALQMVGEQLRLHDIDVKLDLSQDLPQVMGDKNQIEQVILNLMTNARDAIGLKSVTEGRTGDSKGILEITTIPASDNKGGVEVLVKDTGSGVAQENLEKLFTPFFTTKPDGKGTGLGLSISLGIIKDHHGEIDVVETGPWGTTFRIWLQSEPEATLED